MAEIIRTERSVILTDYITLIQGTRGLERKSLKEIQVLAFLSISWYWKRDIAAGITTQSQTTETIKVVGQTEQFQHQYGEAKPCGRECIGDYRCCMLDDPDLASNLEIIPREIDPWVIDGSGRVSWSRHSLFVSARPPLPLPSDPCLTSARVRARECLD